MITKQPTPDGQVSVTFHIPSDTAATATVAGEFNGWSTDATPMQRTDAGLEATVLLSEGRAYRFRYLLDGTTWVNDWAADGYADQRLRGQRLRGGSHRLQPMNPTTRQRWLVAVAVAGAVIISGTYAAAMWVVLRRGSTSGAVLLAATTLGAAVLIGGAAVVGDRVDRAARAASSQRNREPDD